MPKTEEKALLSDDGLKKIVDRWTAGAFIPDPPYPSTIVRDTYEADRKALLAVIQKTVDALAGKHRAWCLYTQSIIGGYDQPSQCTCETDAALASARECGVTPTQQ